MKAITRNRFVAIAIEAEGGHKPNDEETTSRYRRASEMRKVFANIERRIERVGQIKSSSDSDESWYSNNGKLVTEIANGRG